MILTLSREASGVVENNSTKHCGIAWVLIIQKLFIRWLSILMLCISQMQKQKKGSNLDVYRYAHLIIVLLMV